jgi:hypothetical protein
VPTATAEADQDQDADRYRHTEVDGSKVVKDEVLLSGLSNAKRRVPLHGTRVLTLADGRRVYACRDCSYLGDRTAEEDGKKVLSLRGDIRKHRYEKHGVAKSGPPKGRRRGGGDQVEELPLDDVDQAGLPYPNENVRGMQLGDLLEFAESVDQWGRVMGALTEDRDQWKDRALAAEQRVRQFERALGKLLPAKEGDGS